MPARYVRRIVAFLDILGFSQLVESASDDQSANVLIDQLEAVLTEDVAGNWIDDHDGLIALSELEDAIAEKDGNIPPNLPPFSIRMFSDCVSVSAPAHYPGFIMTLVKLASIQRAMLQHKRLLRGAVAIGRHHESQSLIFSDALIRAYHLEHRVAIYPRIIVDAPLITEFLEPISDRHAREVLSNIVLLRDADNQVFINYHNLVDDPEINVRRRQNLRLERDIIVDGKDVHRNDASILMKLAWLERYHNFVCQHIGCPDLSIGIAANQGFQLLEDQGRNRP